MPQDDGVVVCKHLERYRASLHFQERPETVERVTPKTTFDSCRSQYAANKKGKLSVKTVYGDLCLVVRIGKVDERSAYPTVAQLERSRE